MGEIQRWVAFYCDLLGVTVLREGEPTFLRLGNVGLIQQSLRLMNLQIHYVLSDITGAIGLAILNAILAGYRDPLCLAHLWNIRVKKPSARQLRRYWWNTTGLSTCSTLK